MSRLRSALGAAGAALETVSSGYRLVVAEDAIDARRFKALLGDAGQRANGAMRPRRVAGSMRR